MGEVNRLARENGTHTPRRHQELLNPHAQLDLELAQTPVKARLSDAVQAVQKSGNDHSFEFLQRPLRLRRTVHCRHPVAIQAVLCRSCWLAPQGCRRSAARLCRDFIPRRKKLLIHKKTAGAFLVRVAFQTKALGAFP